MKTGTIEKLVKIGIRNDKTRKMMTNFSQMPPMNSVENWTQTRALFKTEGTKQGLQQINIGLGKALETFNENIVKFEIVK